MGLRKDQRYLEEIELKSASRKLVMVRLESLSCGRSSAAERNIDLKKLGRSLLSTFSEKFDPSFRLVPRLGRDQQHHVEAAESLCGNELGNLLRLANPLSVTWAFGL